MRPQKVSVDVWKMIFSSCCYLCLAFVAWVFLKLAHACIWLPRHLRKEQQEVAVAQARLEHECEELGGLSDSAEEEVLPSTANDTSALLNNIDAIDVETKKDV